MANKKQQRNAAGRNAAKTVRSSGNKSDRGAKRDSKSFKGGSNSHGTNRKGVRR